MRNSKRISATGAGARIGLDDPRILLGEWNFARTIDDRVSGRLSRATGTARFTLDGDDRGFVAPAGDGILGTEIVWEERGILLWQGTSIDVMRTLRIRETEARGSRTAFAGTRDADSEDPTLRGSVDPTLRNLEDPALRDLEDPALRDSADWEVLFEDGSFFHPWRVQERVDHPCADDLYAGLLTPERTPRPAPADPEHSCPSGSTEWSMEWTVRGPAKDYTLRTLYVRTGRDR